MNKEDATKTLNVSLMFIVPPYSASRKGLHGDMDYLGQSGVGEFIVRTVTDFENGFNAIFGDCSANGRKSNSA